MLRVVLPSLGAMSRLGAEGQVRSTWSFLGYITAWVCMLKVYGTASERACGTLGSKGQERN